ncbi:MAG: MoaD/ThiS family protein [Thermodesulfobacteriota bacterium]
MKVKVLFQGILSEWAGKKKVEVDLPEYGSLAELILELKRILGTKVPAQVWHGEKKNINPMVWVMRGQERLVDPQAPLKDGEEITFILGIAGG